MSQPVTVSLAVSYHFIRTLTLSSSLYFITSFCQTHILAWLLVIIFAFKGQSLLCWMLNTRASKASSQCSVVYGSLPPTQGLFSAFTVEDVTELTLGGNAALSDVSRLQWNTERRCECCTHTHTHSATVEPSKGCCLYKGTLGTLIISPCAHPIGVFYTFGLRTVLCNGNFLSRRCPLYWVPLCEKYVVDLCVLWEATQLNS